jgi:hypothetical protein
MTATVMRFNEGSQSLDDLRTLAVETVGIARQLDNPTALFHASFALGVVESACDPAAAIGPLRESLELADRVSDLYLQSSTLGYLCRCYAEVGDVVAASTTIRQIVIVARDSGSRHVLAQILDYTGQALIILGWDREGATLIAAATQGQLPPRIFGGIALDRRVASEQTARARLGPDRYDDAVREGAAMTPETAIAYTINVLDRLTDHSGN